MKFQPTPSDIDIHSYDTYIVTFSGGKDSMALVLLLISLGVPKHKIELWHHDVDGREGSDLMDWPITREYCKKFAAAFGLKIYFSWKEGGFEREMNRNNTKTAAILFEDENHVVHRIGGNNGNGNTRLKFPQVSADLSVRWCSAYLKIDVCSAAIRNQPRFANIYTFKNQPRLASKRTLVLSGERGEESTARSKYSVFEPDRADNRGGEKIDRWVDRWRPLRDWTEKLVWELIEQFKVRVHPAYYMGWGRVSCRNCIFMSANQCASIKVVDPEGLMVIAGYEKKFGVTIKRKEDIEALAAKGIPYSGITHELATQAMSQVYDKTIIMSPEEEWVLPQGAFGESCGPM